MSDITAIVTPDEELKVEVSEGILTLSSTIINNPTIVNFLSDVAIVTPDEELKVEVSEGILTLSSTIINNPTIVNFLSEIGNVDNTTLQDGSVLVYKSATNKWTSTKLLDQQNIEAGEF
jgi:hypothetical protein